MSRKEEIYRSSYEELQRTMENQLEAYARVNQLAVDLAKIDLLVVSAILAGISISGLALSIPLVAGLLSFLYALWCCARIYEPRSFARGIGAGAVDEIDDAVQDGRDIEEHYRELMFSYKEAISYFTSAHSSVKSTFRNALWSSVTAIVFFSLVFVRNLRTYPYSVDVVFLFVVPVVLLWGKDKYGEN